MNVSMSFIAGMSIALGFLFCRSLPGSAVLKRKTSSGREGMIGMEAEVVEDLAPVGLVKCRGEIWRARSGDGASIPRGRTGSVAAVQGMTLVIEEDGGKVLPAGGSSEKTAD